MRWQQPAARPARRGAARRALGWAAAQAAVRAGVPCALRPTTAARNLQEAAGPGEASEGAWLGAGGLGPAGSSCPSGGSAGKDSEEEGRRGQRALGPRGLRAGPRGAAGAAALPSHFPQGAIWRLRARPERPRQPCRWRDFALRSERRDDLYPAWERVRAPPRDCSVWRAELRDGPRGRGAGEHGLEIRRSAVAAAGSVSPTRPPPARQ